MHITSFRVVGDPVAAAAQEIAGALSGTGSRSLALSRGGELCRHLAATSIEWERIDLFQVDERVAGEGSADRNLTAISDRLLARLHPMPIGGDLEWGAAAYAATLEQICGSPPVLDVVHLGLGPDGHTASLVPGDAVLDVRDRWVAVTESYQGFRRMTMTYPVLDKARCVVIVAEGAEKARAVAAVRNGEAWAPAARLASADVRLIVDAAAAGAE